MIPESLKFPEQKKDIQIAFSEAELAMIAAAIFPKEKDTFVNFFVKDSTGQGALEGYQKVLLAPANAIEGVIQFGITLFDSKGRAELAESMAGLYDAVKNPVTRQFLRQAIGKGWASLSVAEKTAVVVELISSALFMGGGISRLEKMIPAAKLAPLLKKIFLLQNQARLARLAQAVGGAAKKTAEALVASPLDEAAVLGGSAVSSVASKTKGQHEAH